MGHMSPRIKAKKGRFGPDGLAPIVRITSPNSGDTFASSGSPLAASVQLVGEAFDDLTGDVSGTIVWTSDKDGALGSGQSVSPNLSVGRHRITARVTVGSGTGEDKITVIVT